MSKNNVFQVGQSVFIRTVTSYYVGTVKRCRGGYVYLSPCAWVADTGRFAAALATGNLSEVEAYPVGAWLNKSHVTDVSEWTHPQPITK